MDRRRNGSTNDATVDLLMMGDGGVGGGALWFSYHWQEECDGEENKRSPASFHLMDCM